jgi:hypothetical protein
MSCEIIQFSTAARIPSKRRKPIVLSAGTGRMSRVEIEQEPEQPARDEGELTVTCQNRRLRDARREAWREAGVIREYWKARWKMESAKAIDKIVDPAAPPEERAQRRRRLTEGPEEFREVRVDRPKKK